MFKKILIANRGAIACRIMRTLKTMGIASVAVYAEADADSLHVEQADEAFSLGEGKASDTYLAQEKIIAIAKQSGAEAIHPGYGFLSENANFVALCEQHGIRFIGPSVANMQAFALKHSARELAQQFQVPLVPGSGLISDVTQALSEAERIGYPVILKSSAGGGGIGMHICHSADELEHNFAGVLRLSRNNFSDDRVFLEKYIEYARHIEVQMFGDGQGTAINLGERDCSLQRRNQKVIEEAPAPNLSDSVRDKLHRTAEQLLAGVHYANAGTVEFIFDTRSEQFYFLEVNTRLQVEHGVTEEIFGVDLVQWMIEQAWSPISDLSARRARLSPRGHAIQARVYAENPAKHFQPSAGLLGEVRWPPHRQEHDEPNHALRIDSWISAGVEVAPWFDPMLAKVIYWAEDRASAIDGLHQALSQSSVYGIATNLDYLAWLLRDPTFTQAQMYTRYLSTLNYLPAAMEVLAPGTLTTIQDLPGRLGYWEVGVPPSGPFDSYSFKLGNELLANSADCAGLEITMTGPTLKFFCATQVVLCGAEMEIWLDDEPKPCWEIISVKAGQILRCGKIQGAGARSYLLIKNGIHCPAYLGSRSTFTLGQFGGHVGRALKTGDLLTLADAGSPLPARSVPLELRPPISRHWLINVIYGPHGAPDFFTPKDIATFFASDWEVHYNSSRTGVRLIGPKPEWARESGGEAGMHPSNIHDNAYAFGSVDFTGDMPVILGPDGPSLGGFVCPATVIQADLWKLGQLRAGDTLRFNPVSIDAAVVVSAQRQRDCAQAPASVKIATLPPQTCLLDQFEFKNLPVVIRPGGDHFLLVELGKNELDLRLRIYVHALRNTLEKHLGHSIIDLTPGIRSLQIHYDPPRYSLSRMLDLIHASLSEIEQVDDLHIPSRIVHLPLSWNDEACQLAIEKYQQSVRKNAPWYPSNIEFIRRINGLSSVDEVKRIVFDASYVVMGLGDVYLGAPVATPIDPRHRLITTKYNPARTWTAENSVGIGGAYLCIYGMEGPGGYQFIGRTLQMWNRYRNTREFTQPWLLRFFDQIRFYQVEHEELIAIRKNFPKGNYPLRIEESVFSLHDYENFLAAERDSIQQFQTRREAAFAEELQRWKDQGQFHFDSAQEKAEPHSEVPTGVISIESQVAGSVWQVLVEAGQQVEAGQTLLILESMKMEIAITSHVSGKVHSTLKSQGAIVSAGQALIYIEEA